MPLAFFKNGHGLITAMPRRHLGLAYVFHWIYSRTIIIDCEMQVRTRGIHAGIAYITGDLSLLDILVWADREIGHMGIHSRISIHMVDGHRESAGVIVFSGRNIAASGSVNRCSLRGSDINAVMDGIVSCDRMGPRAIRADCLLLSAGCFCTAKYV